MGKSAGEYIKDRRKKLKKSLKSVSAEAGISDTELMKIEKDERKNINWDTICKLSKILEFNPIDMLLAGGYITKKDIDEFNKIRHIDELTESDLHSVQDFIDFLIIKNNADENQVNNTFRMGELFCGAGGIACGALMAHSDDNALKIQPVWATDFDPDTCHTYIENICHGDSSSVFCEDVRTLDLNKLGPIDGFAYGFPCNSFSNVGKHQGLDNENFGNLYHYGVDVLNLYNPKWFFAENVTGIQSAGAGEHFKIILNDLKDAGQKGYTLVANMYKFEEYGVPQTRHRIIVVGIRNDLHDQGYVFHVPSPKPYKDLDITAGRALENIPKDAPNNEKRALQERVKKRLSYIKPGQNVWQATDMPDNLKIHTKTKISQIYRKLDPSKPAYTVTASGGGGTFMYHWSDEQRELTNRERARLQTFPDDYKFFGNYSSVRKQIGMAVPPQGAKIIFNAILNTFAGIKYDWIEPSLKE